MAAKGKRAELYMCFFFKKLVQTLMNTKNTHLIGPAHGGEGEEGRAVPRVQHIRVLHHGNVTGRDFELQGGLCFSVLLTAGNDPTLGVLGTRLGRNTF